MSRQLDPLDTRIPAWDKTSLMHRHCPFCESEGIDRYIRPDGLHVRTCPTCHCYFISPAPSPKQLASFYSTYYSRHRTAEHQQYLTDAVLLKEMLSLDPLSDVKVRTLASLMNLRGKRILDVGFGMGQSLVLFRKLGAIVTGIDLDRDSVEFAHARLKLENVSTGDILSFDSTSTYDLITLHDLIEHPSGPLEVLKKARSLLAPGGMISIWTPNASSADIEDNPVTFRVDLEHMQYLTFQTCRLIATTLRMTITHLSTHGSPKLGSIRRLSDESGSGESKRIFRRLLGPLPGFVQLNTLRKRLSQRRREQGTYHLFCVMRE